MGSTSSSESPVEAIPDLPKKMKALKLTKNCNPWQTDEKGLGECFEVVEVDVPVPKAGEILVKMENAPINPSDLSTFQGTYTKACRDAGLPCTIGSEGSGTVVASGGGFLAWYLGAVLHKRVSIITNTAKQPGAMYAEYAVAPATQCLVLPDNVSFVQGCEAFVNPLTCLGFIDVAQQGNHKSMVHTAAASALGKMLVRVGLKEGINIICVVRREEQKKDLLAIGAKDVVVTSDEDWQKQLKDICTAQQTKLCFDAVAGPDAGTILSCLYKFATLYVYGGLSNQPVGNVRMSDIGFEEKVVRGWYLPMWLREKSMLQQKGIIDSVASMLNKELETEFHSGYPMDKMASAVFFYTRNMSAGKVCVCPSSSEVVLYGADKAKKPQEAARAAATDAAEDQKE